MIHFYFSVIERFPDLFFDHNAAIYFMIIYWIPTFFLFINYLQYIYKIY